MAFNYPFTILGGSPAQGLGANVNISGFTVSSSTFKIPAHTVDLQLGSYNSQTYSSYRYNNAATINYQVRIDGTSKASKSASVAGVYVGVSSDWASAIVSTSVAESSSINTSDIFNSTNSTSKTATLTVYRTGVQKGAVDAGAWVSDAATAQLIGTEYITLNAPPSFNSTQVSFDTPYVYTGLTTASITISNATAYYGGSISDITLQIGTATDSISGDGTLSILLDTVGTFTPTVTATDSRGQTKKITLDPITVSGYNAPTVNFTAERTTSTGIPDDEGTYATLDATFIFTDVVADLIAPSVVATDEQGTQTTPTVTWYTSRAADGTLSGSVTWSSLSYGDTVYGLVPNLNTNYSYQISVRPRDTKGTGTAIVQTIAPAFYTVDFLAGGHGVAFGQPASTTGFVCNMTATFNDTTDFGDSVFIELPNYQTSSTTDKALYDAIVALGWDSDVLS